MIKCLLTWYENDVQKLYTIKRRWQNVIQYANFLSSHAVLSQHYYIINKRAYLKLLVFLFFNVFGICFTVLGICPHTLMLSCFFQNTLKHFDTKFHTPRGSDFICCFRNNSQIIRYIHYHLNVSKLANTSIKVNLKIAIKRCWMKEEIWQEE